MASDNRVIKKLFFKLLPVQIVLIAMGSINSIIDGTIAGHYINERSVGVIGLFFVVITIVSAISAVILGGASVISGNYIGTGEIEKASGAYSLCISLSLIFGIVTTFVCYCFPEQLGYFCGSGETLNESFAQYSRGYSIGFIPMVLAAPLSYYLQIENQSKRNYISVVVTILFNIILNVIFVAVFDLGVLGLAYATSACNWIFFLIIASYYFSTKTQLRFDVSNILWEKTIELIKIGSPGALAEFFLAAKGLTLNRIILHYGGEAALSSRASWNMLEGIFIALAMGCGVVIRTLTSVYVGEEDRDSIKYLVKLALTRVMAMTFVLMLIMLLFSGPLAFIFFPDNTSDAYFYTKQQYMIYALALPLILLVQIQINYLQASKNNIAVHAESIVDGYFSSVIPAVILAPLLGVIGVWLSDSVGRVLTVLVYPIYAVIYWKHIPKNTNEWMLFRNSFGATDDDRLVIEVNSMEDVVGSSERIQKFVTDKKYSEKTAYFSALAMEEMAGNIVEHGFSGDNKKHALDVRVISMEKGIMLRIKDDCIPFNPIEMNKIFNPEDPYKNIGIRMISKLADEFTYQNTFGLNVLTIVMK